MQGKLHRAGYESHSGDDSYTYEAYADYTYEFGGRQYSNDRVGIAGGADNIGDYQQDLGRQLSAAHSRGETVTVYVDPDEPSEAILDRSVRWGLIGFKSIFLFTFGGIGLGLIIFVFRAAKEKDPSDPRYRDAPWLANDEWQTAVIKSGSKTAMWAGWAFAAFWNLISAPLPFVIYTEVTEKITCRPCSDYCFRWLASGLLPGPSNAPWNGIDSVLRQSHWIRFPDRLVAMSVARLTSICPYDASTQFSLTLTNLHSYMSGSGKDRRRSESAEWQDTQVAHVSSSAKGSRLSFRFDVPENLVESDADQSEESYYLWRINVRADLPGVDIDRDYEIPVYVTGESSAALSQISIDQARNKQNKMDIRVIENLVDLSYASGGRAMRYPMGRNLLSGFMGLIIGGIFTGAGWYLVKYESALLMGGAFGLVGLLIVVSAFYFMLNSLEVLQDGRDIRTIRRILGIPVKHGRMRRADFVRFSKKASSKTQSGKRHVIHYTIFAADNSGQKLVVGEGFTGASQADAAADFIARQFGLTPETSASDADSASEAYNLLTAD